MKHSPIPSSIPIRGERIGAARPEEHHCQTGGTGAPFPSTVSCPECSGTGEVMFLALDSVREEVGVCDLCDGVGEVEALCQCGEPLDADLWCDACEALHRHEPGIGLVDVEMWKIDNGRFGVGA